MRQAVHMRNEMWGGTRARAPDLSPSLDGVTTVLGTPPVATRAPLSKTLRVPGRYGLPVRQRTTKHGPLTFTLSLRLSVTGNRSKPPLLLSGLPLYFTKVNRGKVGGSKISPTGTAVGVTEAR